MLDVVLVIGLPFSALGSLMAYMIAFREYSHHFVDKRDAIKQSLQTALTAFVFLVSLTVALGLLLNRWL
jgi:uncharacterized membrane protein